MALTLASEEDVVEVYKCARVVVVALYGGAGGRAITGGRPPDVDGWMEGPAGVGWPTHFVRTRWGILGSGDGDDNAFWREEYGGICTL